MLTLAFDTATEVATVALARNGEVLAERLSRPVAILADVDAVLREAGVPSEAVERIAVGTGPGSYTGLRMGLITARVLSLSLAVPVAGVSTLDALAAGAEGAVPVIDARRGEIFTNEDGKPRCLSPEDLRVERGRLYVGDGAVRYRYVLEAAGGVVPEDDALEHVPWAHHHARLAQAYGAPELIEPLYLRVPDAEASFRAGRLRV